MKKMTLKQLRYFEALASCGHFGRAAETCAISQPALSMQIRDLETSIGAPLFERGTQGVRLTSFGEAAADRIRAILQSVDELEDLARSAQDRLVGPLKIGVIPTIAPYLLPAFIRALSQDHPNLNTQVRESITPTLIQELIDGRLDMAILALPVSEPSLVEVPVVMERFLLVRPYADRNAPLPSNEALREMRLLLLEEGHCFRDQALAFCDVKSLQPREVMDASSLSTLVQMVSAGLGVTLIPEMAVDIETRSANVAVARFDSPEPTRTLGMVWRKTSALTAQYEQIAEIVRRTMVRLSG